MKYCVIENNQGYWHMVRDSETDDYVEVLDIAMKVRNHRFNLKMADCHDVYVVPYCVWSVYEDSYL